MNYEHKLNFAYKLITVKQDVEKAVEVLESVIDDANIESFPHFNAQALAMRLDLCFVAECYDDCREIIDLYHAIDFKDTELDLYAHYTESIQSIEAKLPNG